MVPCFVRSPRVTTVGYRFACRTVVTLGPLHSGTTKPTHEVPRTPAIVSERHHFESIGKISEDHVIRKRVNRHTPNVVIVDLRNAPADLRKLFNQLQRAGSFGRETIRHTGISVTVPTHRLTELELRERDDPERLQRPRTSF